MNAVFACIAVPVLAFYCSRIPAVLWPLSATVLVSTPLILPHASPPLFQVVTCIVSAISFKLAALAMGRGVLAEELDQGAGIWRFTGVLLVPFIPSRSSHKEHSLPQLATLALAKGLAGLARAVAFNFLAPTLLEPALEFAAQQSQHPVLQTLLLWPMAYYLFGLLLWLQVLAVSDLIDALGIALFQVIPEPHFNSPPKATSLAELWARRWNLTVTRLLKDMVYAPIVGPQKNSTPFHASEAHKNDLTAPSQQKISEAQKPQPTRTRKILGSVITFAFSGLWHELIYIQIANKNILSWPVRDLWAHMLTTRGLWVLFFVIQAPAILLEARLASWLAAKNIRVPRLLKMLALNITFVAFVSVLFVPPLFWEMPAITSATASAVATNGTCHGETMMSRVITQGRHDHDALLRILTKVLAS